MKKFLSLVCISLFLFTLDLPAQVRRIVLLEEATNASCAPCAANNPKLQSFFSTHFGSVISVRYHAWWPGTDPMYTLNTVDSRTRINYYGITGVPNYLLDGVNYGVPGDPGGMAGVLQERLKITSPVQIKITASTLADSVKAAITVIGFAAVSQTNLCLQTAVIERLVAYTTPPGSNGEKNFEDVMRKMLPDGNGTAVASIKAGDTLRYTFACAVDPSWRWQDLAFVAWLQSNTTKEVIQSNINFPTVSIASTDKLGEFITKSTTYIKHLIIRNDNPAALRVRVKLNLSGVIPSGWSAGLLSNGSPVDSIVSTISAKDSLKFDFRIIAGNSAGTVKAGIQAANLDDPYLYSQGVDYFGTIANGDLLYLSDTDLPSSDTLFFTAMNNAGAQYTRVDQSVLSAVASDIQPAQFKAILWNVGWAFPAFTKSDITFLSTYLSGGGRLFTCGQDIGWDIFDVQGNSAFQAAKDFYHTYLGANYLNDNSGGTSMTGISGDLLSDGLSFSIAAPYGAANSYPEQIDVYTGVNGTAILKYNNGQTGGVRTTGTNYKTVYIGVGMEQIGDAAARNTLMKRVLTWFGVATGVVKEEKQIPLTNTLEQNFPNPFNPATQIRFSLSDPGMVSLTIFDVLGREVSTLVKEYMHPGIYHAEWDASSFPSGTYIYRLTAGNFTQTKKLLLVR
jgi:hypothetical protein